MLDVLFARIQQKHRTMKFPDGPPPELPDRFKGLPRLTGGICPSGCTRCAEVCPTGAITPGERLAIDLGKCLFCSECESACGSGAIRFTGDYRLSARRREDLFVRPGRERPLPDFSDGKTRLFRRSLKLRQVSAGGCNACEADINVLGTVGWDLGRFGIQFVASPRHADGIVITGPVPENMRLALMKTYEAVPSPKLVVVVGACAVSGGVYAGHEEVHDGATDFLPIDLFIPGCPPHPLTILDGLLRLTGRIVV